MIEQQMEERKKKIEEREIKGDEEFSRKRDAKIEQKKKALE